MSIVVLQEEDLRRIIREELRATSPAPREEYISQAEACRVFRISEKTLKKYREAGSITTRVMGRKVLFSRHEIETACIIRNPETR